MIGMKFDAGSIGSNDRLRAVARLGQASLGRKPVVVTSALPKVTDLLLQGAHLAAARDGEHEDRLHCCPRRPRVPACRSSRCSAPV